MKPGRPGKWCTAVVALALACAPRTAADERLRAQIDPAAPRLTFALEGLAAADYELRIETPGLTELETSGDINEPGELYLPAPAADSAEARRAAQPAELFFFFHDLGPAPGWRWVAEFPEPIAGQWKLNARFSPSGGPLAAEVALGADQLMRGENFLLLRGDRIARPRLSYRRKLPPGPGWNGTLPVLTADWRGRVSLVRRNGATAETVAAVEIAGPEFHRRTLPWGPSFWTQRAALREALVATGAAVWRARIEDRGSPLEGGFHLVFDLRERAYRLPHWIWSWGPAIDFLLALSTRPEAQAVGRADDFRASAIAAARRSLQFEINAADHPAGGLTIVRGEPARATELGLAEYASTADSLFLAGWGWMPAYRATGNSVFLERTRALVGTAERLMGEYPVVPQDWIVERSRWTPHTLDESLFGTVGFQRLFAATNERGVADAGRRFLEGHLTHMGRDGGLLQRAWLRDENRGVWEPDVKGHAWVLEGYLDGYRLTGDRRYLALARTLAERVIACQRADGAWTYLIKPATNADAPDDKATAIWAHLLYELHGITPEPATLEAARRALGWCLRHQERGNDPRIVGAIVNDNGMAYLRRRPMTVLYSTTFFGLALIDELSLPEEK